ncbi:hypothetical protein ACSBR2_025967 [Camellia fascicularis]
MATPFNLPVTAAQVGTYFVGQYYQVLQQQPDFVHQLYSEGSTMLRIDGNSREPATAMLAYFGLGGENPELYFSAASSSLLKAALNTKRDKIQRLFGQREGIIIKASEEQIKATTHHEEGGGIWPFGGESKHTFNLFSKHPSQLNHIVFFNGKYFLLKQTGSMTAPYYNSRATKIAVVTNGEGYFEMACTHLSSSEFGGSGSSKGRQEGRGSHQQQCRSSGPSYQKVSGRLSRGVVFIVPPDHPVITLASKNQNLQIVCFDVNALNNKKFPLAGSFTLSS